MEKFKSSSATDKEEGLDLTPYRAQLLKFYQDHLICKLSIDPAKMVCTMTCLEKSYDDDIKSLPDVCQLLKKTENAEYQAWYTVTPYGQGFLDFARLANKKLVFSIGTVVNISQDFYLPETSRNQFIHKLWLGYIGNTSFESHTVTLSVHGQILLRCQYQVALVDNKTRRSTKFPDWWKNKYVKFVDGRIRYTFSVLDTPHNTLSSKVTVVHNDTDENQHTNWLAYPMYCINSLNIYISQGHFKGETNICRNWIKRLEMFHLGESLEGDNLVVHIWKEEGVDIRFASHIYKEDKCIFQCVIDYYSSFATSQL